MAAKKLFTSTQIWVTMITVTGSVIVALIASPKSCGSVTNKTDRISISPAMKNKAGLINQFTVYNNYDELYPFLSEPMKVVLSKTLFNMANDSILYKVGRYIKPIDTTGSIMFGARFLHVKNQHEKGISITSIGFDDHDNIINLYVLPKPQ